MPPFYDFYSGGQVRANIPSLSIVEIQNLLGFQLARREKHTSVPVWPKTGRHKPDRTILDFILLRLAFCICCSIDAHRGTAGVEKGVQDPQKTNP